MLSKPRLLLGVVVALALPASLAFAAAPTKDGRYAQIKKDRYVVNLHVDSTGKKIDEFSAYGNCNAVPFDPPLSIRVNRAGAFKLTGRHSDVIGEKHKLVISGKFISAQKVRGKYRINGKGCKGKTVRFKATLMEDAS